MSDSIIFQKVTEKDMTEVMINEAAELFSSAYGVWGPEAKEKINKFCKEGCRVKMSANKVKEQCLAKGGHNSLVRALNGNELAGYAFATRWEYEGRQICWITQLCVKPEYRGHRLATRILLKLREGEADRAFGLLSSHPAAVMAALRAFGRGIEEINLDMVKQHGHAIMVSSPVNYVKSAAPKGILFNHVVHDGSICCAFTDFWVDHKEPLEVLQSVKAKGVEWPLGELPEGCEFLVIVKGAEVDDKGERVRRKENTSDF